MPRTRLLAIHLFILLATCALTAGAGAQQSSLRPVVVISDLHMGLGRGENGQWLPTEDFRWPLALRGFLDKVAEQGGNRVDLVIAGDFLELWQRPTACLGSVIVDVRGACTVAEMTELAEKVAAAHKQELGDLSKFAATGENCVIVVPGNHDASLVLDAVWGPVGRELSAKGGCVRRAGDGLWSSANGRLLVEHGHQIGKDANKYDDWPSITRRMNGSDYVVQPWGESFVQNIFNGEETRYPLIDNLSPSSAGVRYLMADRGLVGAASDVARFLRFNLADTSLRQKLQILGANGETDEVQWDRKRARALGYRLFQEALAPADPFAVSLASGVESWSAVRTELDSLAVQLSDAEVDSLCDQLAIRRSSVTCLPATLGATFEKALYSRAQVLKAHLRLRKASRTSISAFAYGHTHSFEMPWDVGIRVPGRLKSRVVVANSGAFQRLVDDDLLQKLASAEGITPQQFLKDRTPESLPACYTSIHVGWDGEKPILQTRAWLMAESDPGGRFVDPCGAECPNLGHGCFP